MAKRSAVAEQVEEAETRTCECGCNTPVVGKKARFAVGHDTKLKSALLAHFDSGDEGAG
jgi:hypothetical protein